MQNNIYAQYAQYAIMISICRICTPHFADGATGIGSRPTGIDLKSYELVCSPLRPGDSEKDSDSHGPLEVHSKSRICPDRLYEIRVFGTYTCMYQYVLNTYCYVIQKMVCASMYWYVPSMMACKITTCL